MNSIAVRTFQPSDIEAARSLLGELHEHELSLQPHMLPWGAVKEAFWTWLTSYVEKNSGFMLVAECGGKMAGFVGCWFDKTDYPAFKPQDARFGYVSELVVSASARRQGVGAALLKAAEKIFLERGMTSMRLQAFANNKLADDFYIGYGMEPYVTVYKKHLDNAA
ncbi:MAG: GNAT family N-acetyltransferase [Alphaproteobacteria bacterium]|nr:GNAT family N-acetyltransferase [Alphaproteobacteria bacterium]